MTVTSQPSMRDLFEQGMSAFRSGNLPLALQHAEAMIERDSGDANGWLLRSQVRTPLGMPEPAMDDLQRALRLMPSEPQILTAVGYGWQTLNNHEAAIAAFDDAIKLDPNLVHAAIGKAQSHDYQGDAHQAEQVLQPLAEGPAASFDALGQYLHLLARRGQNEKVLELGERFAQRAPAGSRAAAVIHAAIAKAHENLGQYSEAFDSAHRANQQSTTQFSQDDTRRAIDDLLKTCSPERMRDLPRVEGLDTSLPVFVMGMPRTGSTLIERIIDAHPDAVGRGEHATLQMLAHQIGINAESNTPYPACINDLTREIANNAAQAYLQLVSTGANGALRIVDKFLTNYKYFPIISSFLPQSHVIISRRDPVDTSLSCYFEMLSPMHVPWAFSLDNIAFMYAQHERIIQHFQPLVDVPMIDIQYESLVSDSERITRQILEHCDLPWDNQCSRFFETERSAQTASHAQVRKPIYDTSVGRAKKFGDVLDPLRETLDKYGVTVNDPDSTGS